MESLSAFDPLTGEVIRKLPRFTFYPKTHYATPRETLLGAIENIKRELAERLEWLRSRIACSKPSGWSSALASTWK